ncbi:MAG: arylamine N-acetyltransferase [Deinococcota bacterium]
MDIDRYLARFGSFDYRDVSLNTLTTLHRNHLQHVPFENLDIPLKRRIELSPTRRLYTKIVEQRRGGFCYELNGLFYELLTSLGYDVQMLAGRVHNGTNFGPPFDHLLLLVNSFAEPLLVDVGFGDSFLEPLKLTDGVQPQANGNYHITLDGDGYTLWRAKPHERPSPQYTFSLESYQLADFVNMCEYQQTSSASTFTQKSVCSIATDSGRVTISNGRLITTDWRTQTKQEGVIGLESQYRQILIERFGVDLPVELDLGVLLAPEVA